MVEGGVGWEEHGNGRVDDEFLVSAVYGSQGRFELPLVYDAGCLIRIDAFEHAEHHVGTGGNGLAKWNSGRRKVKPVTHGKRTVDMSKLNHQESKVVSYLDFILLALLETGIRASSTHLPSRITWPGAHEHCRPSPFCTLSPCPQSAKVSLCSRNRSKTLNTGDSIFHHPKSEHILSQ